MDATVSHRCALCSEVLSREDLRPEVAERMLADHHAVCPKRPIEVGEAVRIVRTVDDYTFPDAVGQTGTIVDIDRSKTPYCVKCEVSDRMWCKEVERIPRPDKAPTCAKDCECQGIGLRRDPSHVEDAVIKERYSESPAPALVDGIDREVCLARWMENRLAVEGGGSPPNVMTSMQRDVARELWLQRFGAARSAELRERVAADREAERCRVRVDLEVQPWE